MAQVDTILNKHGVLQPKSDLEELDPIQIVVTRQVVETIVQTYDPSLTIISFNAEAGSGVGDNYMAILYLVNIRALNKSGHLKLFSVMLKTMPLSPARQAIANLAFIKEVGMYEKVLRGYVSFQKKLGFNSSEIYSDYPLHYASVVNGKSDYLALENLRTSGYKMADRQKGLDKDHIILFLKSLAKFHALSYVQFRGSHEAILETYPEMKEVFWISDSPSIEMSKIFMSTTIANNVAGLREAGFESEAKILEGPDFNIDEILAKMDKFLAKPAKYSVLGHGDCWTNNMLFKYNKGTGKPTGIKLIDFQISRPCSRTIDLHYFLLTCPQEHLVNDYEEEFLHVYYNEFSSFAKKLGFFDPELTFEQLQEEYNEYRGFAIINSMIAIPFFYAKSEDVKDMELITQDLSEKDAKEFLAGISNNVIIRRIKNILNVHFSKVKF